MLDSFFTLLEIRTFILKLQCMILVSTNSGGMINCLFKLPVFFFVKLKLTRQTKFNVEIEIFRNLSPWKLYFYSVSCKTSKKPGSVELLAFCFIFLLKSFLSVGISILY